MVYRSVGKEVNEDALYEYECENCGEVVEILW